VIADTAVLSARGGVTRSLANLLTRRAVHRLAADQGTLERGADYAKRGLVRGLRQDGDLLVAEVAGTRRYRVRLWVEDGELAYACTCPIGEDGRFCKHCVATGLSWVDDGPEATARRPTLDDLRAHLGRQTKDVLVELLMEQATVDEHRRRRLLLEASRSKRR
jgi:uncharacterized Zn finger protein